MAEDGQRQNISAAFPAPPPFYKNFTAENVERVQKLQNDVDGSFDPLNSVKTFSIPNIADLPPELRALLPPPLPSNGKYYSFGEIQHINPIPPVVQTTTPIQPYLHSLTRKLLLTFLDMTHALSVDPDLRNWSPRWEELNATFREMHKVINEYRPHQARETLIQMMEERIRNVKDETQNARDSIGRAKGVVEGLQKGEYMEKGALNGVDGAMGVDVSTEEGSRQRQERKERRLWELIGREVGPL